MSVTGSINQNVFKCGINVLSVMVYHNGNTLYKNLIDGNKYNH